MVSPKLFLHEDTRVSEFIDPNVASWKGGALDAMFLPHRGGAMLSLEGAMVPPKF